MAGKPVSTAFLEEYLWTRVCVPEMVPIHGRTLSSGSLVKCVLRPHITDGRRLADQRRVDTPYQQLEGLLTTERAATAGKP